MHEQEAMERFIQAWALDTMRVDISDGDVGGTMERIADWMENIGGLYAMDK